MFENLTRNEPGRFNMINPRIQAQTCVLVALMLAYPVVVALAGRPSSKDTTPPAAVTDLAVVQATATQNELALTWTETGDDGMTGQATAGNIYISVDGPIDASNWQNAEVLPYPRSPLTAGTPETFVIEGLETETPYYFAIKVYDEVGNASPLSNCASGATLPQAWDVQRVATDYPSAFALSLACSSEGQLALAYPTSSDGFLKCSFQNPDGTWGEPEIVGASGGGRPKLLFGGPNNDVPMIGYRGRNNNSAYASFVEKVGGQWTVTNVDGAASGSFVSLAIARDGEPALAYVVSPTRKGGYYSLKYAKRTGGQWTIETVLTCGTTSDVSLAFDQLGYPAIVSRDTGNKKLSLTSKNPTTGKWDSEILVSATGSTLYEGVNCRLAFNPLDNAPTVVWQGNSISNTPATFMRKNMTTGQWDTIISYDIYGGAPDLLYDPAGTAHISCYNATTYDYTARYVRIGLDNTMESKILMQASIYFSATALALDPVSGKISIAVDRRIFPTSPILYDVFVLTPLTGN